MKLLILPIRFRISCSFLPNLFSIHALCTALNGSRNMDVEEYAKICDALGLDYEYFFDKRAQAKLA